MDLKTSRAGDALIIRVAEERLDAAVAVQFKEAFRAATASRPKRAILDLEQVTFLDSSGLGAIVAAMKLLAPEGKLELASLSGPVAKVFRLTRMDSVFVIHPDLGGVSDAPAHAG